MVPSRQNVLLAQARRDLRRFASDPGEFASYVAGDRPEAASRLAAALEADEESEAIFAFEEAPEHLVSGLGDRVLDGL